MFLWVCDHCQLLTICTHLPGSAVEKTQNTAEKKLSVLVMSVIGKA